MDLKTIILIIIAIHVGLAFLCFIHIVEDFVSSKRRKVIALVVALFLPIIGSLIAYKMMSEYSEYNLSMNDGNSNSGDNYTGGGPDD